MMSHDVICMSKFVV